MGRHTNDRYSSRRHPETITKDDERQKIDISLPNAKLFSRKGQLFFVVRKLFRNFAAEILKK